MILESGAESFTTSDMLDLAELVGDGWTAAAGLDWSAPAGDLEWSCLRTADHAVDCVWAPAMFLASRNQDTYPMLFDPMLRDGATPEKLVLSLGTAARTLAAVINDADDDVRAIIFGRPDATIAAPRDFAPRGAMELILHAHDVSLGLGIEFEPPADMCHRLREHTRPWPMWTLVWNEPGSTDDPWADLLTASGRSRR